MDCLFKEYTDLKNRETKLKLAIGLLSLLLLGTIGVFSSCLVVERRIVHQKEAEIRRLSALESKVEEIQGEKEKASSEARDLLTEGKEVVDDLIRFSKMQGDLIQMQENLVIKLYKLSNPSYWLNTEPSQINSEIDQIKSIESQIYTERKKINSAVNKINEKLKKWYGELKNF